MGRGSSRITDVFDEVRQFEEVVAVMRGDCRDLQPQAGTEYVRPDPLLAPEGSGPEREVVIGLPWFAAALQRLEQRVAAIEAELAPSHRSHKCPCCRRLTLEVVATRPHPEFGFAGIEQHEVLCSGPSCGYSAERLYDPNDYIR